MILQKRDIEIGANKREIEGLKVIIKDLKLKIDAKE